MNWEENEKIIDQMIKGSTGELWGARLEQADHYKILRDLLESAGQKGILLDVGCGAGDVARSWNGKYIGIDLDWVIEKVSKVCNPNFDFHSMKITPESIKDFPDADVIFMNAFLDVLENPHEIFDTIMSSKCEKIIVHRQRLSQDKEYFEVRGSYANSKIPSSVMSLNKIVSSIHKFPNAEFALVHWQSDFYSFMVIKNEIR